MTPRIAVVTLAAAALAVVLYLPFAPGALLADDWFVMQSAATDSLHDMASWLDPTAPGWYRPLTRAFFVLSWRAFGTDAAGHHALGILLYGVTTLAVGALGASLSGDPWAAPIAALAFAAAAPHAEAVLWIAAANELWAGLLFCLTLLAHARYLRRGGSLSYAVTLSFLVLALAAKETVLGLPVALLAMALWLPGERETGTDRRAGWRGAISLPPPPWLVAAVVVPALLVARSQNPLPYDVPLAPVQLVRNALYSTTMVVAALPADATRLAGPAPSSGPTPEAVALAAALGALLGLAALALRWRPWADCTNCRGTMGIAVAVLAAGLLPAAPIVAERTTYVASIGGALLVAGLVTRLARSARRRGPLARLAVPGLFAVLVLANVTAARHRAADWARAGTAMRQVMDAVAERARGGSPDQALVVLNLPDTVGSAYAFRNAFPAAAALWPIEGPVIAHVDAQGPAAAIELVARARLEAAGGATVLDARDLLRPPGGP